MDQSFRWRTLQVTSYEPSAVPLYRIRREYQVCFRSVIDVVRSAPPIRDSTKDTLRVQVAQEYGVHVGRYVVSYRGWIRKSETIRNTV